MVTFSFQNDKTAICVMKPIHFSCKEIMWNQCVINVQNLSSAENMKFPFNALKSVLITNKSAHQYQLFIVINYLFYKHTYFPYQFYQTICKSVVLYYFSYSKNHENIKWISNLLICRIKYKMYLKSCNYLQPFEISVYILSSVCT